MHIYKMVHVFQLHLRKPQRGAEERTFLTLDGAYNEGGVTSQSRVLRR